MNQRPSVLRIAAAVVAACALWWLVDTVNRHGDDAQRGAALMLQAPRPVAARTGFERGGLDLIDMSQCMCASGNDDEIKLWIKWWVIAAVFGGLPIAILIRQQKQI